MAYNDRNIIMEDVKLVHRNFAGKEGQYNREGERNFSVLIDESLAKTLDEDGWLVKWFKQKTEEDPVQAFLPVSLRFDIRPPKVVMITSRGRTQLDEEDVELLDYANIIVADIIVRPYDWAVGGKGGIKAYVQSLFVTIEEDYLDLKYSDVPIRGGRSD